MTFTKESRNITFIEGHFTDIPMHIKIGLRRKLLGTITVHLFFVSLVTSVLKFTPLARFYINENEWIFHLVCILLFLIHIVLLIKRNEYNINIVLLFMHLFLQALVVAAFVTYYDTLGVLQGVFLTSCVLVLMFFHLVLFGKTCDLCIVLCITCLVLFTLAMIFQMMFGCTFEELIMSVVLALCLSFYYLYSVHLTACNFSLEKFCIAVVNVYTWPFISFSSKMESLLNS